MKVARQIFLCLSRLSSVDLCLTEKSVREENLRTCWGGVRYLQCLTIVKYLGFLIAREKTGKMVVYSEKE